MWLHQRPDELGRADAVVISRQTLIAIEHGLTLGPEGSQRDRVVSISTCRLPCDR